MKRFLFASDEPIDKTITPAIGQRWVFNLSPEETKERLQKMAPEKRAMMEKFFEISRTRGFVLMSKTSTGWMTHINPKNPHPRSKEREIKDEWLKQYKFKEYD